MPSNRLEEPCAKLGAYVAEHLPIHAGYILILIDPVTGEAAVRDQGLVTPETPRSLWLDGVKGLHRESPILHPDMFDRTGGVLPHNGVRSLPSGRKPT